MVFKFCENYSKFSVSEATGRFCPGFSFFCSFSESKIIAFAFWTHKQAFIAVLRRTALQGVVE